MEKIKEYIIDVITCKGKIREENEDNFLFNTIHRNINKQDVHFNQKNNNEKLLVAVFDGMGGEKNGNIASLYASETLKELYQQDKTPSLFPEKIIEQLNNTVCELSDYLGHNCGTTVAFIIIQNNIAQICNVGDSRIYMFRNNNLTQLTQDHTERETILKLQKRLGIKIDNSISSEGVLTQFLGIRKNEFELEPFIHEDVSVEQGDLFLICTDGLSHFIDNEQISEILKSHKTVEQANKELYQMALQNGCSDNITSILLKIEKI